MSPAHALRTAARPHSGRVELALLAALYGVYELVRGFGGEDWAAVRSACAGDMARSSHRGAGAEVGPSGARGCGYPN